MIRNSVYLIIFWFHYSSYSILLCFFNFILFTCPSNKMYISFRENQSAPDQPVNKFLLYQICSSYMYIYMLCNVSARYKYLLYNIPVFGRHLIPSFRRKNGSSQLSNLQELAYKQTDRFIRCIQLVCRFQTVKKAGATYRHHVQSK